MLHGKFAWHGLHTSDMDAARKFYMALTNWKVQKMDDYEMWASPHHPITTVMPIPSAEKNTPSHWELFIGTKDIKATIEQACAMGAKLVTSVSNLPENSGHWAALKDPSGAGFSLMETAYERSDMDEEAKVGDFSWWELAADDYEKAWKFYQSLFGWELSQDMDSPAGTYRIFMAGPKMGGGIYTREADNPAAWLSYIRISKLDTALERCKQMGGTLIAGPMSPAENTQVAICMDPQGAAFALHESVEPA